MNSELFFRNTQNITSFGSSFLNEKSPQIYKIFKEIFGQITIPSLNNKPNGLPNLEAAKKPSFCSDFNSRFNNLFGLFNYEFCYIVTSKINVKKILNILIDELKFKNAIMLYNTSKLKFLNSESFKSKFMETAFYDFHFCNDNKQEINIQAELLRKMIFDKIIEDIAQSTISNREDVYNECSKILRLIIDDSLQNQIIKLTPNDFKTTPFFKIASNLKLDFERIKTTLGIYNLINDELKPNMEMANFPYLISLIKDVYPNFTIEYDRSMLDIIINYFISLSLTLQQEINIIVGFEKSSRIQLVHILKAVAYMPYANLNPDQMQAVHYILFTADDISKGYEAIQSDKKSF